jgi:hypothetical protein
VNRQPDRRSTTNYPFGSLRIVGPRGLLPGRPASLLAAIELNSGKRRKKAVRSVPTADDKFDLADRGI